MQLVFGNHKEPAKKKEKMSNIVPVDQTRMLSNRLDAISTEYQICRRKLESKNEALLIMNKELDQCRSERDQFKLMAEQVRDRYQMLKRQLSGDRPMSPSHITSVEMDPKAFTDIQTQGLAKHLFETKEANKALQFEVDDLKQKLQDAEGDIKLLREQIARSRVGTTDEGLNTRHFPAHEREDLVKQLEKRREEYVQLERDLQQVLDEKEELETARDAYRTKNERINMELNFILGGDERRIVDVDALNMENKYLNERLKQMEEEKTMAIETVTKYKTILEKKNSKGGSKLGQSRSGGLVITQKQVQEIVQTKMVAPNPYILADLQSLCTTLLDTINDKNLALSHQRKTNKLLGNRVNELEKKLKTLEVSGLWSHNVSGEKQSSLEKLITECEEIKTLVPRRLSQSTDTSEAPCISDFSLGSLSENSSVKSSPLHLPHHPTIPELRPSGPGALSQQDIDELGSKPQDEAGIKKTNGSSTENEAQRQDKNKSPLMSILSRSRTNSPAKLIECNPELSSMKAFEALEDTWQPLSIKSIKKDKNKDNIASEKQKESDKLSKYHKKSIFDDDSDLEDSFTSSMGGIDTSGVNDDDDEESTEEFKTLVESVTSKLLKASNDMNNEPNGFKHIANGCCNDEDNDAKPLSALNISPTNIDSDTFQSDIKLFREDSNFSIEDDVEEDTDDSFKKSLLDEGKEKGKTEETLLC